eukprot:2191309-Pleurochrysis_carterae.AAC.1
MSENKEFEKAFGGVQRISMEHLRHHFRHVEIESRKCELALASMLRSVVSTDDAVPTLVSFWRQTSLRPRAQRAQRHALP